jgi:hypothetical protein
VAAGLILSLGSHLIIERTGDRLFRVTSRSFFFGQQFRKKTVEGVTEVVVDDADRNRRSDSLQEKRRQRRQKHLNFFGNDGARVGWDRESDYLVVGEYMRGTESSLILKDLPPTWRLVIAWFFVGLGSLTLVGAVQNALFPKSSPTAVA